MRTAPLKLLITVAATLLGVGVVAVLAPPASAGSITSITPNSGPLTGGTSIVISGSGFTGVTVVDFLGPTPATSVVVVSDTQITAVTPALPGCPSPCVSDVVLSGPSISPPIFSIGAFTFTSGGGGGGGGSSGGGGGTPYDWESANSPDNPAWLPQPVVAAPAPPVLTELTPDQLALAAAGRFEGLTAQEFSKFTAAQLKGLSAAQVASIPPSAFALMTPAQLAALPAGVFGSRSSAAQIAAIPAATFASMTVATFTGLGPNALTGLTPAQLAAVPAWMLRSLTPDMAMYLPPSALAGLTPEQLKEIPAKSLRRATITSATLTGLTPQQLVAWVQSGALKNMTTEELTKAVKALSPEMAAALLTDPEKLPPAAIAALSPKQIAAMPITTIGLLNRDQLAQLTPAQVRAMSKKQLAAFNNEQCDSGVQRITWTRTGEYEFESSLKVTRGECSGQDVRDYLSPATLAVVEGRA